MTGQKFAEGRTDKKQIWQHGSYEEMKKVSLCFVCCGFRPREEIRGGLLLNLAKHAGLPAAFPLRAADLANIPGTGDKMFSKICSAAQALRKILLEISQNCR